MSAGRDVVCLRREGYRLFVLACEAIVGLLVVVYRSRADRRSAVRTGAQTEARGSKKRLKTTRTAKSGHLQDIPPEWKLFAVLKIPTVN